MLITRKHILILGEGPTQGLNGTTTLTAEEKKIQSTLLKIKKFV